MRALSQTSNSLRAFTLPILWAITPVETVREVGIIVDTLRSAPSIAPLVRHFALLWTMDHDFDKCCPYSEEHGSLLDMAFIDRRALWDRAQMATGARVARSYSSQGTACFAFDHDGVSYRQPGFSFAYDHCEKDVHNCSSCIHRGRTWQTRKSKEEGTGPDGKGEDPRIKNPDQLLECFTEVVSQLSSLETFQWSCAVMPMPQGVFDALKEAQQLSSLTLTMTLYRGAVQACEC